MFSFIFFSQFSSCSPTPSLFLSNFLFLCFFSLLSFVLQAVLKCLVTELCFRKSYQEKTIENSVPAGNALAIAREDFSKAVTKRIDEDPNIELIRDELTEIPEGNVIIASGPLTSEALAESIKKFTKVLLFIIYDFIVYTFVNF